MDCHPTGFFYARFFLLIYLICCSIRRSIFGSELWTLVVKYPRGISTNLGGIDPSGAERVWITWPASSGSVVSKYRTSMSTFDVAPFASIARNHLDSPLDRILSACSPVVIDSNDPFGSSQSMFLSPVRLRFYGGGPPISTLIVIVYVNTESSVPSFTENSNSSVNGDIPDV